MIQILPLLYKDILEVHWLAWKYFQKRFWEQLFSATWKNHKSKFEGLIHRMKRHHDLVKGQASLSQFRAFQAAREEEDKRHQGRADNEELRQYRDVYAWLKPVNISDEQSKLRHLRADCPRTGQWLTKNETFEKWIDPKFPTIPALLWLNGQPGAGQLSRCHL
jgi:hypothetical protein